MLAEDGQVYGDLLELRTGVKTCASPEALARNVRA